MVKSEYYIAIIIVLIISFIVSYVQFLIELDYSAKLEDSIKIMEDYNDTLQANNTALREQVMQLKVDNLKLTEQLKGR